MVRLLSSPVRPAILASLATGVETDSVVVARALRSLSRDRLLQPLGRVDESVLSEVKEILAALLDLPLA